jgi:hypothetical protein
MVRDHASFGKAKYIHNGRIELLPDAALAIKKIKRPRSSTYLIYALSRTGKEKQVTAYNMSNLNIENIDWPDNVPKHFEMKTLSYIKIF